MCQGCWDVDKRAEKMRNHEACNETIVPFMTLDQMKSELVKEWRLSHKTDYRIYKDALFSRPNGKISWSPEKGTSLNVQFV